jgi:hypothetical protein
MATLRALLFTAALALGTAGCVTNLGAFVCTSDASCGAGRMCIDQSCAAPDPGCAAGYRWDDTAGARGGQCAQVVITNPACTANGNACMEGKAAGQCLNGTCCTGCIAGTACQTAMSVTVCGIGGVQCMSCDDGNDCTADACQADGTCSHTAVVNGTSCAGTQCRQATSCPGCNECAQVGACQAGQCMSATTFMCCPGLAQCHVMQNGRARCFAD